MTLEEAKKKVDTESVGKADNLTLEELAEMLRKIFPFRYLTVHHIPGCFEIILHENSPFFDSTDYKWKSKGVSQIFLQVNDIRRIGVFLNRDFSKCIVEV